MSACTAGTRVFRRAIRVPVIARDGFGHLPREYAIGTASVPEPAFNSSEKARGARPTAALGVDHPFMSASCCAVALSPKQSAPPRVRLKANEILCAWQVSVFELLRGRVSAGGIVGGTNAGFRVELYDPKVRRSVCVCARECVMMRRCHHAPCAKLSQTCAHAYRDILRGSSEFFAVLADEVKHIASNMYVLHAFGRRDSRLTRTIPCVL